MSTNWIKNLKFNVGSYFLQKLHQGFYLFLGKFSCYFLINHCRHFGNSVHGKLPSGSQVDKVAATVNVITDDSDVSISL